MCLHYLHTNAYLNRKERDQEGVGGSDGGDNVDSAGDRRGGGT